ncbi:MAG TPA: fibrillarin-like rRNA/tRNA 2'-O-methyltransferase [Candidatus Nanoarchaeia archaeon]|nr:fibrillarin-like rRNA/tRNA 2'-O-methyltransferase [Candidatus Nanoarchaeia archaeon]
MIKPSKIFEVFIDDKWKLFTRNLTPGKTFFNEVIAKDKDGELREWDAKRSKLAAAIAKGASNIFIRKGSVVLYLGAAHGYTPSYISDIVGKEGFIFALDSAPRVVRDLVFLANERTNIAPILADAHHPEEYADKVTEVDIVYQDVAQRDQAQIFLKNCDEFLAPGGYGLLAVKARSVDVTRHPKQVFEEVRKMIEKKMTVVDFKTLDPFEKDHCFIFAKKR